MLVLVKNSHYSNFSSWFFFSDLRIDYVYTSNSRVLRPSNFELRRYAYQKWPPFWFQSYLLSEWSHRHVADRCRTSLQPEKCQKQERFKSWRSFRILDGLRLGFCGELAGICYIMWYICVCVPIWFPKWSSIQESPWNVFGTTRWPQEKVGRTVSSLDLAYRIWSPYQYR